MTQYIVDSKQINLSSSSSITSDNGYNSTMLFQTNGLLKNDKTILYNTVSVIHCQLPVSYYVVNQNNNLLSLSTGNITLTLGNYTATTFKTMLLGLLGSDWSISISSSTGQYTLTYTSDFTINASSTCYKIMGFAYNTSYTSSSYTLTLPYPCNFLGINRIKIKSQVFKTNNIDSNSGGFSHLLATIPVNNQQFGLINYINIVQFKNIIPNNSIDFIDISLTDESDNLINFNGIDVYITLQIDSIRESIIQENDLMELLKENEKNI